MPEKWTPDKRDNFCMKYKNQHNIILKKKYLSIVNVYHKHT